MCYWIKFYCSKRLLNKINYSINIWLISLKLRPPVWDVDCLPDLVGLATWWVRNNRWFIVLNFFCYYLRLPELVNFLPISLLPDERSNRIKIRSLHVLTVVSNNWLKGKISPLINTEWTDYPKGAKTDERKIKKCPAVIARRELHQKIQLPYRLYRTGIS